MQFLRSIFEVFSRRPAASQEPPLSVTPAFRNRVILFCRDVIGPTGYISEFWEQVHQKLEYLHGVPILSLDGQPSNRAEDLFHFLSSCTSEHFLDFVEYIFQVDAFWRVSDKAGFVDQINAFFNVDDLPYFLTEYVEVEEPGEFHGHRTTVIKVAAYPRVVLQENRLVHAEAVAPVLYLLTNPAFASANTEFLDALQDYRKGDFGDCLTKCGSAFESVMKVICHNKKWPYKQTDTASALLNTIIPRTTLDSFFNQPLMLIATIRNRLSKSHGAGTVTKNVPKHIAQFTINTTAAAIILLVEETR
jgi:hypothetical protein